MIITTEFMQFVVQDYNLELQLILPFFNLKIIIEIES